MTSTPHKAGRWLLLAASLALVLCALELAARLVLAPPPTVTVQNLNEAVESDPNWIEAEGMPDGALYVYTPTGTRLRPNSRAIVRNNSLSKIDVEIRTNSLGHRYAELLPKSERDFRILVLGDSITFAASVPQNETYPAFIEAALRRDPQGTQFQVVNAGIGAIDLQNEFAVLLETGLAVQPDVVLVGLYLNDARESLSLHVTRVPEWLRRSRFASWTVHGLDRVRARFAERSRAMNPAFERDLQEFRDDHPITDESWRTSPAGFNRLIEGKFHDWGYAWSDGHWQTVEQLLKLMKEVAEAHDFELVVTQFPVRFQVESELIRDEPQVRFEESMRVLDLPHLDLLPVLRERHREGQADLFYDHCHLTPEGHRLVGEAIAGFLSDRVLGRHLERARFASR